jgi:hypothetical protein
MANINTFLNKIKTAIYGKDVRDSIYDGIDAINKETEETTSKQENLEATFNQLIINAGESNAEVVAARHDNASGATYETLPQRLDATTEQLAHMASLEKSILQNFFNSLKASLILVGLDSLSNGAGNSKWLDYFAPRLRGELGDGGAGYLAFDNSSTEADVLSYGKSSNVQDISSLTPGIYPALYSLDNKGASIANGVNSTMDITVKREFKYATIYYLKQPGGGTFDIGYLATYSSTKVSINTDGELGLGSIILPVKPNGQSGGISVRNINGKVVIFGGLFVNDKGVAISRVGKGGDKFAWHNSTDNTFRNAWVQALQPSLYIFNGGMNDRNSMTATEYEVALNNYLGSFKNNGCQLILLRPNEPSDTNNNLTGFEEKLKSYAVTNKCGYVSNKKLLGETYVLANANGFMLDGVHPNADGNKKIANNLLSYLSIPIIGLNITELITSGSTASQQPYVQLTSKKISINYGTTVTIYKLGFTNSYPSGKLTLHVVGQRNGSTHTCEKRIDFYINNGTTMNNGNADSMLVTLIDEYHASGQPTVDFTVTYAKVNGLLEIYLTPNTSTYNMNFYIDGDVKFTYLAVTGQSVFEN